MKQRYRREENGIIFAVRPPTATAASCAFEMPSLAHAVVENTQMHPISKISAYKIYSKYFINILIKFAKISLDNIRLRFFNVGIEILEIYGIFNKLLFYNAIKYYNL